jgi:hypothetical protein
MNSNHTVFLPFEPSKKRPLECQKYMKISPVNVFSYVFKLTGYISNIKHNNLLLCNKTIHCQIRTFPFLDLFCLYISNSAFTVYYCSFRLSGKVK